VETYQIIGEFEWKERYEISRGIVPGETWVGREIPRLDHVEIVLVKDSMTLVSLGKGPNNRRISYMSIPLVVWLRNGSSASMAAVTYGTVRSLILTPHSHLSYTGRQRVCGDLRICVDSFMRE